MTDLIHEINNYKSRYDFRDLFLVLNIEQEKLNYYLEELNKISFEIKEATISYKKKRNTNNKNNLKELNKLYNKTFKEFEKKISDTGLLDSIKDVKKPELFDDLIDKLGLSVIANRLYRDSLILSFKIIQSDQENIDKFTGELEKLNITYKQAMFLVKSVIKMNEDDYFKVCRIIEKNFLKLPMLTSRTDCESAIIGCLRSEKHLVGTNPRFKLIHNRIDFPEIYLIKFAISKAFN